MTRMLMLLFLLGLPVSTMATAVFEAYTTYEFAPARGQTFAFPIRLEHPAAVTVSVMTADGDLVRTLRSGDVLPAGVHTLGWDGKDDAGLLVPDEAYVPVLTVTAAPAPEQRVDPRQSSGGEVVEDLRVEITLTHDIAYILPAPARVLIRVGIKGGPMLRALAQWAPRGPGKNVQRWDGRDHNGLVDLRGEKDLSILVTAFRLPAQTVLTTGNTTMDYRTYRQHKGWPEPLLRLEDIQLTRGQTRLARPYFLPVAQHMDPRITLALAEPLPRASTGLPLVRPGQQVTVTTEILSADRWLVNESLYEVAFFVNHVFTAEEEQGYLPLTWRWHVPTLPAGRHILTVNLSGFSGHVGVASLLFEVAE